MIGILVTSLRVSVMTSAVADRSGRIPIGGASSVIRPSKSMARFPPVDAEGLRGTIELFPISVTVPLNRSPVNASISTYAVSPTTIVGMSVSSTSITASMTERSATVSSRLPGLFMVPTIAVSPRSTLRRVMRPDKGARMVVFASRSCS